MMRATIGDDPIKQIQKIKCDISFFLFFFKRVDNVTLRSTRAMDYRMVYTKS